MGFARIRGCSVLRLNCLWLITLVASNWLCFARSSSAVEAVVSHGVHTQCKGTGCAGTDGEPQNDEPTKKVFQGVVPIGLQFCGYLSSTEPIDLTLNLTTPADIKNIAIGASSVVVIGTATYYLPRLLDIEFDTASLPAGFEPEQPLRLTPPGGILFHFSLMVLDFATDAGNVYTLAYGGQIGYAVATTVVLLSTLLIQSKILKGADNEIRKIMRSGGVVTKEWSHVVAAEITMEMSFTGLFGPAAILWVTSLNTFQSCLAMLSLFQSARGLTKSASAMCLTTCWYPDTSLFKAALAVLRTERKCFGLIWACCIAFNFAAIVAQLSSFAIISRVMHPLVGFGTILPVLVATAYGRYNGRESRLTLFVFHCALPLAWMAPGGIDQSLFRVASADHENPQPRWNLVFQIVTYILQVSFCYVPCPPILGRPMGTEAFHDEFIEPFRGFLFGGIEMEVLGQALFRTTLMIASIACGSLHIMGNITILACHKAYCDGEIDNVLTGKIKSVEGEIERWVDKQISNDHSASLLNIETD